MKSVGNTRVSISISVGNIPDTGPHHAQQGGHGADQRDGGGVVAVAASPPVNTENVLQRNDALQDQPEGEAQLETRLEPPGYPWCGEPVEITIETTSV